jgi:hypothetical protein
MRIRLEPTCALNGLRFHVPPSSPPSLPPSHSHPFAPPSLLPSLGLSCTSIRHAALDALIIVMLPCIHPAVISQPAHAYARLQEWMAHHRQHYDAAPKLCATMEDDAQVGYRF